MVRLVANYPESNPILNRYAQKAEEEERSWKLMFLLTEYNLLRKLNAFN